MKKYHGGQLLIACLQALGVRHCFGIPGESYLAVLDALHDTKGVLDFTLCRHEGGAAFMAAAYGKLMRTPGICFVTRGPGATNAAIGVHTAMQDSAPMMMFVGQVATDMKGREAFQEIDYRAVYGSMVKWATEIERVDRLPEIIGRAWTTAISGRPGPVVVSLPENILSEMTSVPPLVAAATVHEAAPTPKAVSAVVEMLKAAKRPLIIMGGGGWSHVGSQALQHFAEAASLPVLAAFRYQDQYDNHSLSYVGDAGVGMTPATKTLIKDADVILAINIRFGEMTTKGYTLLQVPYPTQRLVHVHNSDRELGKIYQPDIAIHASPNTFSAALSTRKVRGDWAEWYNKARMDYEAGFALDARPDSVDMAQVMAWLQNRLPDDAILTNGAGNFAVWPNKFFQFGAHQRLLAPQSGAMGYGLPAAIAAKLAYPERMVVCFAGDGDFQMNCQELGTAMQAKAQPIVFILNNGMYGTIRMHQERHYPDRVSGTKIENPDFVALAKSYGYHAEHIGKTADFAAAFERAVASTRGAVLELNISPEALTPRQTLSEIRNEGKSRLGASASPDDPSR